jgi:hypothetical protein
MIGAASAVASIVPPMLRVLPPIGQLQRIGRFETTDQPCQKARVSLLETSSVETTDSEYVERYCSCNRSTSDRSLSPDTKRVKLHSNNEGGSSNRSPIPDALRIEQYSSNDESRSDRSLAPDTSSAQEDPDIDGCPRDRPLSTGGPHFTVYDLMELHAETEAENETSTHDR